MIIAKTCEFVNRNWHSHGFFAFMGLVMKKCTNKKCDKVWLDESEFSKSDSGRLQSHCKKCRSRDARQKAASQYGKQLIIPLPPNTRVCRMCGWIKHKDCFPVRQNKKHHCYCFGCHKEIPKERQKENRLMVYNYLSQHPCVDCGETNPLVLEFDHTGSTKKEYNISDLIKQKDQKKIMKEINKCEVRCRNCHIIKTAERGGWLDYHLSLIQDARINRSHSDLF